MAMQVKLGTKKILCQNVLQQQFKMQEVNIWREILEGMVRRFQEIVRLLKWSACDCSWIY